MATCLDWSGPEHWSSNQAPCRYCGAPTNIRDVGGNPSHKVCAERAIDRLRAERQRQRRHLRAVS